MDLKKLYMIPNGIKINLDIFIRLKRFNKIKNLYSLIRKVMNVDKRVIYYRKKVRTN